jgi:putative transposase
MREVCADIDAELRQFNGETDHVHSQMHYPPSLALSVPINRLNGVSPRRPPEQSSNHIRKYLWDNISGHRSTSRSCAAAHP